MPIPALTYTQNLPNPPNLPSQDVGNMQINTNSIYTFLNVDHVNFGNVNNGTHLQVQLQNQLNIPPGLQNGFETLYSKATTGSGELYFTRGATGVEIQMTAGPNSLTSFGTNPGWTFLPGGLLLQYGRISIPTALTQTGQVLFPTPFSAIPYSITLGYTVTGTSNPHAVWIDNGVAISTTTFNYQIDIKGTSVHFYWMAIGPA